MEKYVHTVQYYETDKMGIAHHSNYIRWMEEARVDFFDRIGLSYNALESAGVFSPVIGVECSFKSPTTFEDAVEIRVKVEEFKGVKLILSYQMVKRGSGEVAATARSEHCFVDGGGKLIVLKKAHPEIDEKLKRLADGARGA